MNEGQEARRIAVIALIAVLATAAVGAMHIYRTHEENKVIAAQINKHFDILTKRLDRLEKKVGP